LTDERTTTISARFSRTQLEALEKLQHELGLSKTDVLQRAVELFSVAGGQGSSRTVQVTISAQSYNNARKLVDYYGYKDSLGSLLSEAAEIGIRTLKKRQLEDLNDDSEISSADEKVKAIDLEHDSMTT